MTSTPKGFSRLPPVRVRWPRLAALVIVGTAVVAFSGAWARGDLVLDGPGTALWVRLGLRHWSAGGLPWWMPEMWAGTPAWVVVPAFPVLSLAPLAQLLGPEGAVKAASLGAEVVGAFGVVILCRALWGEMTTAVVAGLVYGLHPLLVSHLALAGLEPSIVVMALTPWLVWALLAALDGRGPPYVVAAGVLAGGAVLEQPEHVYGLALLTGVLVGLRLATARGSGTRLWRSLVARASAVSLVAFGLVAHWLLPFMALGTSFILTPPELARLSLVSDMGARLGRQPGFFLTRAIAITTPVASRSLDLFSSGGFYLGWVCVALTGLTCVALAGRARRQSPGDDVLLGLLVVSVLALWASTGGVPLARGHLADASRAPVAVMGVLAGLLSGALIRRLADRRRTAVIAAAAAVALMVGAPYVAPFLALQHVVPYLANVRFPRLYPVALVGLALATAYPVTVVRRMAARRRPDAGSLAAAVAALAALAIVGAFLVDVYPYRSFFRVRSAKDRATFAADLGGRIAVPSDPSTVESLVTSHRQLSTGWPYPLAGKDVWRLTFEALYASPPGWRDRALGLSGTSLRASGINEQLASSPPSQSPTGALLVPTSKALPLARVYDATVVVADRRLMPELAVALAYRNVGVVHGGGDVARSLGDAVLHQVSPELRCDRGADFSTLSHEVGAELSSACAMHRWVGVRSGFGLVSVASRPGGVFQATVDSLGSIGVWLDRPAEGTEMVLRALGPDGRALGPEVDRSRSNGVDGNGMAVFPVAPGAVRTGRSYAFELSCTSCASRPPNLVRVAAERARGNLVVGGVFDPTRVAAFGLNYAGVPPRAPATTSVRAVGRGPGRWDIDSAGDRASLLVVAEAWFPGWTATVDGRRTPVLEADGAFLGIAVGPGHHRVQLRYGQPRFARLGRLATFGTIAGCIFVLTRHRRRRKPRAGH